MPIDASVPGSPEWWLTRLGRRLEADRERLNLLDDYDCGKHPLPQGQQRYTKVYERFQKQSRTNFTQLVVDSVLERLQVDGFRMGGAADPGADDEAQRIWQANTLDADSELVHRAALAMSRAYVIVAPDPEDASTPLITPEDPREVIHECDPARRRRVRAALKIYRDDIDGRHRAVVYLPDAWWYFTDRGKDLTWEPTAWEADTAIYESGVVASPLPGRVPVVPFVNLPRLARAGRGEFEGVVDIQDRINGTILNRLIIAAMQAYRQRWMKGVTLIDEQGRPQQPLDPGADLVWAVEDPDAAFGDFQQSDLGGILSAVQADIRDLAAITRTPPHYLLGQVVNASGDALKAAETGLVSKATARQRTFGESWEQAMALAFALIGREAAVDAETIWRDPESRSMAELADAAVKRQAVGVPWRQLMVDLGYTPAEIDRMEAERMADALNAMLTAPPAGPPGQGTPGAVMPPAGQPEPEPATGGT